MEWPILNSTEEGSRYGKERGSKTLFTPNVHAKYNVASSFQLMVHYVGEVQ